MADDVNIVFNIAEKGFAQVQKNVDDLRRKLEELGVDMKTVQTNLDGIERSSSKASKGMRDTAKSTNESTKAAQDNTKATKDAAEAQDSLASPSLRYALYDVANAYKIMGAALAGVAIYAGVVGAQFESAFTNVARTLQTNTTSAEVDEIRNSLVQLQGQIPLTFSEISEIATIGNQMGIAKESIVDFTGTIARFASVSGLSVDAVSQAFGGFMAQTGLAPKYLENLGASIAKVGIDSNATEAQILSLMKEIAAGATSAGFASDQIVGLSGTLASLQIAPERARGSLTTYFETLNRAVAQGGEDLQHFATITGLTADQLTKMVNAGEGAEVFRRFLEGLGETGGTVEATRALNELGLSQLRVTDTFRRLSTSLNLYDRDQQNANSAFMQGAELQRQYAMTLDDLASQWTIFINGMNSLIDAVSGGAIPTLAKLFAVINNVIFAIVEWLGNNRWVAAIIAFGVAVVGIMGTFILFRGLILAATAAMIGARYAIQQMGGTAIAAMGPMRAFAATMLGVGGGARSAAGGILTLRSAIRLLLASTGVGLLLVLLGEVAGAMFDTGGQADDAALSMAEYNDAMSNLGSVSDDGAQATEGLGNALDGAGGSAETAAKKVRTLVDYVNDLTGVFNRSSDLRFGSQEAMDEITLAWIELNEEAEKYQKTIRTLTADKALKEYWLGIAEMYNDQIRASELREEIAKIDDDLAEAQAGASTELKGNSKAAIENRKTMRNLLGSYEDYVTALASAGASQDQIQKVISVLNKDFQTQAQALGYNGGELLTYQARFSDLSKIVGAMPRDITVTFNPDPALLALNEFFARAEEMSSAAGSNAGGAYGDGFGGGVGDLGWDLEDLIPTSGIERGAQRQGKTWWDKFVGAIKAGDWGRVGKLVTDGVAEAFAPLGKAFADAGDGFVAYWQEQFDEIGQLFSNPGEFLPKWFDEQRQQVEDALAGFGLFVEDFFDGDFTVKTSLAGERAGRASGKSTGDGLKGGLSSALTTGTNPIDTYINNSNRNAWGKGRTIGSNIGGGLSAGLSSALSGLTGGAAAAIKIITGGGFAGGGYTGAGHWLEPAGIVHKGEYVIPKRHVNQSTGLPDANYVASLQRSKSAPKTGYAGGGFVSGGMGNGPIELGPASLGAIISGMNVRLNVGQRELAKATSGGDKSLAWTGSN